MTFVHVRFFFLKFENMTIYSKNTGNDADELLKTQTGSEFKEKFVKIISSYSPDSTDAIGLPSDTPYKQTLVEINERLSNLKVTVKKSRITEYFQKGLTQCLKIMRVLFERVKKVIDTTTKDDVLFYVEIGITIIEKVLLLLL